jgi:hypothetical protein
MLVQAHVALSFLRSPRVPAELNTKHAAKPIAGTYGLWV